MRQCPDRYTIRAGRNLPDKEFRYLRTVIVTADTSSFDLAETCVFAKQSPGPILCGSFEHSLFRSYGVNLPSSLTTLLPLALEFSSCPPVSVCGTGVCFYSQSFSRLEPSVLLYLFSIPYARVYQRPGHTLFKCPFV